MAKIASSYLPYLILYWVELCFFLYSWFIVKVSIWANELRMVWFWMWWSWMCVVFVFYIIKSDIYFFSFHSPLCYSNNNIFQFEYYDRFLSLFIYKRNRNIVNSFFSVLFLLLSISMRNSDFESKPYPSRNNGNIFDIIHFVDESNRRIVACWNKCSSFGIISSSSCNMKVVNLKFYIWQTELLSHKKFQHT